MSIITKTLQDYYDIEMFDISDFEFYMFEEYPSPINNIIDEIKDGKSFFYDNIKISQVLILSLVIYLINIRLQQCF